MTGPRSIMAGEMGDFVVRLRVTGDLGEVE